MFTFKDIEIIVYVYSMLSSDFAFRE